MLASVARVLSYAGLALAGVLLGVVGAFLHAVQVSLAGVDVPALLPALIGLLAVLVTGGAALTGTRLGAVVPAAAWVVATLPFAIARPEGDIVVAATGRSMAYLLVGTVIAGAGIGLPPDMWRAFRSRRGPEPERQGETGTPAEYPPVGSSG